MEKVKKPFYKTWWFILICVFVVISIIYAIANPKKDDTSKSDQTAAASTVSPASDTNEKTDPDPTKAPDPTAEPEPTFDTSLGKDISEYFVAFNKNVHNDTTGNWRVAQISDPIDITEYAVSYYQKYFESDAEVHFIINRAFNTTTRINAAPGYLYLSTYEYVDGEEHDAKQIPAGMLLKQHIVTLSTGEVEDVTDAE